VARICSEAYGIDLKRQTGITHPLTSWTCLCASSALVSPPITFEYVGGVRVSNKSF
jgi:hypothetical protein